ncbi:hypothetical protein Q7S_14465 [Rahnella aquatilis HX2]|nr:hypothetical protein Q7S_14465 [Rahnella aquatilis HX2]
MIQTMGKYAKSSLMKLRVWSMLPHEYASFFRILHTMVAFLILSQIINANLTETEAIAEHSLEGVITWMHIISGFGLIICGFLISLRSIFIHMVRWEFCIF